MYNPVFKEEENFYCFIFSNGFSYDIPKETIKNSDQMNEWLMHLRSKVWFSEKLESDFVDAAIFTY